MTVHRFGLGGFHGQYLDSPSHMFGTGPQVFAPLDRNITLVRGLVGASHVRASNATYRDPDNLNQITTLGANTPRFESVGGYRALLIEPAGADVGKNLIQYSHELGNAASTGWWTNVNLTSVTANGMLAPDGNVVADGLIADANDVTHGIYETSIPGIGQNDKVAFTCFGKIGNKDWVQLELQFRNAAGGGLGDTCSYYFNINSGSIGTPSTVGFTTIHDYIIEEAANGFYRIGLIASSSEALADKLWIIVRSAHANTDNDFSGDGSVNTWFWGADLKKQAFFDSHVPTSGATASRTTESGYPLWTLPAGLFDAKGTAIIWVRFGYAVGDTPDGSYGIVSCEDGTSSVLRLFSNLGSTYVVTRDGLTSGTHLIDHAANTWYKVVVKWSSTTLKMRIGYDSGAGIVWGTEVAFDGSYTLGTNLRLAYGLFGPMWLRALRIYDRVLSDIEINAMGSP